MKNDPLLKKLQFSERWIDLGLLTPESLAKLNADYESSDDKNTEHYRWEIFLHFLNNNKELSAETIKALYQLGEDDADGEGMGCSMRIQLLQRKDCPLELLETALCSDNKSLIKAASKVR